MIRMDSLVVVTRFEMNAVACMRIHRSFKFSTLEFTFMRLRCANIRCSSQTIAEIRLEIVLFRYICK